MEFNIDDMPVGGGGANVEADGDAQPIKQSQQMLDEFAPASNENEADNSGPIDQRLASKNWSIRAKAYDELTLLFKGASSP